MLAPPLRRRGQFRAPAPYRRERQSCPARRSPRLDNRPIARNVILLIGDGMGQAHRFAAQLLAAGRNGRLAMDRLPYLGQMGTTSADATSFVTDSAAAATAIATGVKTFNGSVSIDREGQERTTILELAKSSGSIRGTGQHVPDYRRDAGRLCRACAAPRRPE